MIFSRCISLVSLRLSIHGNIGALFLLWKKLYTLLESWFRALARYFQLDSISHLKLFVLAVLILKPFFHIEWNDSNRLYQVTTIGIVHSVHWLVSLTTRQPQKLWPSGISSRLGRNRLWVRFLAVSGSVGYISQVHWAYYYFLGSLVSGNFLGSYGLTQKLCWKKSNIFREYYLGLKTLSLCICHLSKGILMLLLHSFLIWKPYDPNWKSFCSF